MNQASGTGKRKSPKRFSLLTFVLIGDGMLTCQPLKMKKTAAKMQTAAAR